MLYSVDVTLMLSLVLYSHAVLSRYSRVMPSRLRQTPPANFIYVFMCVLLQALVKQKNDCTHTHTHTTVLAFQKCSMVLAVRKVVPEPKDLSRKSSESILV